MLERIIRFSIRQRWAVLGLERRETRRGRADLNLDVGDVGHGVDLETREIVDSEPDEQDDDGEDGPALSDGQPDDAFKHGCLP